MKTAKTELKSCINPLNKIYGDNNVVRLLKLHWFPFWKLFRIFVSLLIKIVDMKIIIGLPLTDSSVSSNNIKGDENYFIEST